MTKLNVGDVIPEFKAKDADGNEFSNEDFDGNIVVLYFYPKDETPGCTKEACDFRDSADKFEKEGVLLFGISPDSAESHQQFIKKFGLNFTLLSDPTLEVCKKFDVINETLGEGRPVSKLERTTFVIGPEGVIEWLERPVVVEGHVSRVLQAVNELKDEQ